MTRVRTNFERYHARRQRAGRSTVERIASRVRLPALRRPGSGALAGAGSAKSAPPPLGVLTLHRAAFGPAPGDLEFFQSLGGDDASRLAAWVDWQLDPESIPDGELEARLAASNFTTLHKSLPQLWTGHWLPDDIPWEERVRPFQETQAAVFLRAVYSRRQLAEVLADFWHNHFNVYGWHDDVAPIFVHHDRDVIRAHALGNFRQMIEAVTASTCMLFYLDNLFNTADGPNENYARELMELHTLGAENYLGAVPASQVPVDADGVPTAFVDEDVRELARCLTGWTVDEATGAFTYVHDRHDQGAKRVLGLDIPPDLPPMEDVRRVLDRLATHPGTARFVSRKLCRRLVADDPPESLVDAVAATFLAAADEPDQLARVVRVILLSAEFAATWGAKTKRPFEVVASAMRAMNPDFTMDLSQDMTWSILWLFWATGHAPYEWRPPTGYPDTAAPWLGSNPLVMTWRMINWLSDARGPDGATYPFDVVAGTPQEVVTAEQLADYWIQRGLGRSMDAASRQVVVDFMAQGHLPDVDLHPQEDESVQSRLRTLAALVLTSPQAFER